MGAAWVRGLLERVGGMIDVPLLSRFDFHAAMRRWQVQPATMSTLSALTPAQRERSVVIVQDAFTRYFEAPLLADLVELISRLGYQVYLAPFSANGKPLHAGLPLGVQPRRCAMPGSCANWRTSVCRCWASIRR